MEIDYKKLWEEAFEEVKHQTTKELYSSYEADEAYVDALNTKEEPEAEAAKQMYDHSYLIMAKLRNFMKKQLEEAKEAKTGETK